LLPGSEPLEEDVGRLELMAASVLLAGKVSRGTIPSACQEGRASTHMRDLFLETVETRDSVLEMVSNWGIVDLCVNMESCEKKEYGW
jgi:hypothetical protein